MSTDDRPAAPLESAPLMTGYFVEGYELDKWEVEEWRTAPNPGYIYVLQAGPFYKIGRSKSLKKRIRQLRIQLPFEARLIYYFASPNMVQSEDWFHREFAEHRINGEWFRLSDEQVNHLCAPRCPEIPSFVDMGAV